MEIVMIHQSDLNMKATELRLGFPGLYDHQNTIALSDKNNKRALPEMAESGDSKGIYVNSSDHETAASSPKAQIVGCSSVKSNRKNNIQQQKKTENESGLFVKVSMDGAPYLRKIDLKIYTGYSDLLKALFMFKLTIGYYSEREGYKGSEYMPTYVDKDGDLMLVGDFPCEMFISSCKRLRILKGAEARGLGM